MPDQKPPRHRGPERDTVLALLQYQRESLVRKLEGVSDEDARRSPVPSGTSLLWLAKHMGRAEAVWVLSRFAGMEVALPADDVSAADTMAAAVDSYRRVWPEVDAVVVGSRLDDLCRNAGDDSNVNLRWVLMHLLEETARHAGHADILREMIDGSVGR